MKTLNKPPESLAGNLELYLTPISNIARILDRVITYSDEDLLLKVICKRETLNQQQTATKTAAGTIYAHKITASLNGRSYENDKLLEQFSKYKLLAIVCDSHGNYYSLGNQELGLTMEYDYDSGTDPSGINGYIMVLKADMASPSQHMIYLCNDRADVVLQSVDTISD